MATLLDRLETKGLVTSDRRELAFVYRPAISSQEVRQRRVSSLVDKLYQGEPGLLVLHLLKSHPIDAARAKEVRAVLDQMTGEKAKKKNAPRSRRAGRESPPLPRGERMPEGQVRGTSQDGAPADYVDPIAPHGRRTLGAGLPTPPTA